MTSPRLQVSLRLRVPGGRDLGPGKIRLLELVGETGSIAAAGRAMRMSYARAWALVRELDAMFAVPLVARHAGGTTGGGATLTPDGAAVVARYRSLERAVYADARADLATLAALMLPVEMAEPAVRVQPSS